MKSLQQGPSDMCSRIISLSVTGSSVWEKNVLPFDFRFTSVRERGLPDGVPSLLPLSPLPFLKVSSEAGLCYAEKVCTAAVAVSLWEKMLAAGLLKVSLPL